MGVFSCEKLLTQLKHELPHHGNQALAVLAKPSGIFFQWNQLQTMCPVGVQCLGPKKQASICHANKDTTSVIPVSSDSCKRGFRAQNHKYKQTGVVTVDTLY